MQRNDDNVRPLRARALSVGECDAHDVRGEGALAGLQDETRCGRRLTAPPLDYSVE